MAQLVTDQGKPTEIKWNQDDAAVRILSAQIPTAATSVGAMPTQSGVQTVPGDLPGQYSANWFMSPTDGLVIESVTFTQTQPGFPDQVHQVARSMRWRHARLIVDTPLPTQTIAIPPLSSATCSDAFLVTQGGTRTSDQKAFAWAAGASFGPLLLPHPLAPGVVYTVTITQAYLFAAPAADQEPSGSAVAIKVYPTLSVTVQSSDPANFPPPSFAADLRILVAPRRTRDDQHRPPSQFPSTRRRNTNVVNLACDANAFSRGIPGQGLVVPTKPEWDVVFDYFEPDLTNEAAFDAVVFPRNRASTQPFRVLSQASGFLECQRVPGQGEFDNLHVHPWVGFDDPADSAAATDSSRALIEAPVAADEVFHLHWRWGVPVTTAAQLQESQGRVDAGFSRNFQGFSAPHRTFAGDDGGVPNSVAGAPLIPSNQSLRIRVANPLSDVGDPLGALDNTQTAVWYSPVFHQPPNRGYTQFFSQGFGLAYRLRDLGALFGLVNVTNSDLLDATITRTSYHDFRWTQGNLSTDAPGQQRVPTASKIPGLQLNRIGTHGLSGDQSPPIDQQTFVEPP